MPPKLIELLRLCSRRWRDETRYSFVPSASAVGIGHNFLDMAKCVHSTRWNQIRNTVCS